MDISNRNYLISHIFQSTEPVEIVGMLRDQDRSNSFTPVNNPEKNEWVFPNIDQMAAYTGSEPVLVDEIFSQ